MSDELLRAIVAEVQNVRAAIEARGGSMRPEPTEFITRGEAAAMLRCSLPTLDKLRAKGLIPWAKPGQEIIIRRADVEKYLHKELQRSVR